MVIRPTGNNLISELDEFICKGLTILYYLLSIFLEGWIKSLLRTDSLGSDDMLKRSALSIWENGAVNLLC